MYCECFTQGRFCDESCSCKNCCNNENHTDDIRKQRKNIRTRNPLAFKPKVMQNQQFRLFTQSNENDLNNKDIKNIKQPSLTKRESNLCTKKTNLGAWHINGCKCKKSNCQKKYCECFQMGVLCKPDKCQCCDCKNTKEDVERRMANDDFLQEFADFIE